MEGSPSVSSSQPGTRETIVCRCCFDGWPTASEHATATIKIAILRAMFVGS